MMAWLFIPFVSCDIVAAHDIEITFITMKRVNIGLDVIFYVDSLGSAVRVHPCR